MIQFISVDFISNKKDLPEDRSFFLINMLGLSSDRNSGETFNADVF